MLRIAEIIIEWLALGWAACALGFLSDLFFYGKRGAEQYTPSIIIVTTLFGPLSFVVIFVSWYRLWKGRNDRTKS
jgi:hypothetical protein